MQRSCIELALLREIGQKHRPQTSQNSRYRADVAARRFFLLYDSGAFSYIVPSFVVAANASREPRNISTMTMSYPVAQTLLAMAAIYGMQWFRRIKSIEYAMAEGGLSAFTHKLSLRLVL